MIFHVFVALLSILSVSSVDVQTPWVDKDGDGVPSHLDCDDTDPTVYFWQGFYLDEDHDGYGTGEVIQWACWGDEWYHQYPLDERSFNNLDCDDFNPLVNPAALELCDGLDNDCDPDTADGVDESWFGQLTICGFGEFASTGVLTCQDGVMVDTCVASGNSLSVDVFG